MKFVARFLGMTLVLVLTAVPANSKPADGSRSEPRHVRMIHAFAACMADRREQQARALLAMDFRDEKYGGAITKFNERHHGCAAELGNAHGMRMNSIVLTGALAEALVRKDLAGIELGQRTAYDPAKPTLEARNGGEFMAICVVRTAPAAVARLFAAEPGSAGESDAITSLSEPLVGCVPSGEKARFTRESLRSLLALAAYRLFQHNLSPSGS